MIGLDIFERRIADDKRVGGDPPPQPIAGEQVGLLDVPAIVIGIVSKDQRQLGDFTGEFVYFVARETCGQKAMTFFVGPLKR